MYQLILFIFLSALSAHAQSPAFRSNVERAKAIIKLEESSPCILALANVRRGSSQVSGSDLYCVLDQRVEGRSICRLTGYNWQRDTFLSRLPNGKGEMQVDQSCYEGGLDQLLSRDLGTAKVRDVLHAQAELLFSADKEFTEIYNRGAATPAEPPAGGASTAPRSSSVDKGSQLYTPVKVFFATDRNLVMQRNGAVSFGGLRNDSGGLDFGLAQVSIPKSHQKGRIEGTSIFRLEFVENAEKHMMIQSVRQEKPSDFMAQLRSKIVSSREGEAFVFIHGYNTTFEDGLLRTAQLAYDLNFDGAPILYSWPAGDKLWKYSVAEANVEWTFRHLQSFLVDVARESGAKRIHLIAHSMGNRALTNALSQIQVTDGVKPFHQIILAAPDIDTQVFGQIAGFINKLGDRVTIYASEKDEALVASQKFHSYRRLGQGGDGIFTHSLTDTVDASKIEGSLLGHSYFGDSEEVLSDLWLLLAKNLSPELRPSLAQQKSKSNIFWRFLNKDNRK